MKKIEEIDFKTPAILIELLKSEINFKNKTIKILEDEIQSLREENKRLKSDLSNNNLPR